MKQAKISVLKSKLSAYVAAARRGESLLVMDRNTAVAKLVPIDDSTGLVARAASCRPSTLRSASKVRLFKKIDVVALLREDRDSR